MTWLALDFTGHVAYEATMNPRLRAAVIAALAEGHMSRADLVDCIGVSRESIKIAIRTLYAEGTILPAGTRRDCAGSGSPKKLWRLVLNVEVDPSAIEAYQHPISEAERFWPKVNKNGPTMAHMDSPCWEWIGGRYGSGYGQFYRSTKGQGEGAHRVSWMLSGNVIAPGKDVLHHCDNPPCVNPTHLYVGDDHNNRMDALRRGRDNTARGDANGSRTRPDRRAKAEGHGNAKLTWAEVEQIRTRREAGEILQSIADAFGVSPATVHAVVHGHRWVKDD